MAWCIVEKPDGTCDRVDVESMSFDGGSLVLFSDAQRTRPKAAYSPTGWQVWRWEDDQIHG
ncbi:hypothetical protein [Corynebacterium cystitidis]|uniref:hypothetical protein n=1 Tax=Corynebacterium cystitidis TaxID=35757 RepID=UPI00211DF5D1|nr:hypothetical protein [Corynebacterium cystitidis]